MDGGDFELRMHDMQTPRVDVERLQQKVLASRRWAQLRHFIGSPTGAALGGILYAAWAAVVNSDGGLFVSLRSSFGQFLLSTLLTIFDARLMHRLFVGVGGGRAGALTAAIGSLFISYAVVIGGHHLIGTPHIFWTILPGVPPTLGFTLFYTLLLSREHSHST